MANYLDLNGLIYFWNKIKNFIIEKINNFAKVATTGSYNDLLDKPVIPDISGYYQKPLTGIPKTDMSSAVLTSLSKADSAYSKPSEGIPKTDLVSTIQTSLEKADTALLSYTETDPIFVNSVAHEITSSDITNWNSKTSNIGTITGITMNGVSKGTSGVINLGTVITAHQDISEKVDKTTTVNGKALSSNITLTASDVDAIPVSTIIPTITFRQW